MALMDLFRRSSGNLPRMSKPPLIARIGEEEHPALKKKNADGGPFVEDWSEGKSGAVRTARFSYDGSEIVSLGTSGFQVWDGKTGALKETITVPTITGHGVRRSQIEISPDRQSFVSYGEEPRPGTRYTNYWSMFNRRSAPDGPITLPGWIKENMLSGVLFLPLPNRVLRWGYKGEGKDHRTYLDLIATDKNTIIDTLPLPMGADVRNISPKGYAFIGWHEGVMALDCSEDKLSQICQLDLETAGAFGSGHAHSGVLTANGKLWVVSSRFEGERTGVYRGVLSAWDAPTKQKMWSIETSYLSRLWREISSVSIHPNGQTMAVSVIEGEVIVGKLNKMASCVVLVNIGDGTPREYFKAHRNFCVARYSGDGERILTVSGGECAMKLWGMSR